MFTRNGIIFFIFIQKRKFKNGHKANAEKSATMLQYDSISLQLHLKKLFGMHFER